MKPPEAMTRVVNRTRYDVEKAVIIAGDDFWDGNNWERSGRNSWLYRTPKGLYFVVTFTQWQGEQDRLEPVELDEAIELFERQLCEHRVDYSEAFPGVEIVEA